MMEQELANAEFWLPPEFLTHEDIFSTRKPKFATPTGSFNKLTSAFYGYSNLSSPVESVMGSTETESDEQDYLNGLTRKFTNTTLHEDFYKGTRVMSGSPQSTLCGSKHGFGSTNCSSPPATAAEANGNQTYSDLVYAAAGELARMRMVEEAASRYQQLQVAQFQKLKQQQIAKQYLQMMMQIRSGNESGNGRPVSPPVSTWHTPQQPQQQQQPPQRHPGVGMRAVFLGNPSTKRESTGTGVFLPRQTGAPTGQAKKRGCSTVLLPDRVVQALNLNLETMEAESKLQFNHDAEIMYRQSAMMSQQRRNGHRQQPPAAMSDFRLPQEWTY